MNNTTSRFRIFAGRCRCALAEESSKFSTIESVHAVLNDYDLDGKAFANVFANGDKPAIVVIYDMDCRALYPAFEVSDPNFEAKIRNALFSIGAVKKPSYLVDRTAAIDVLIDSRGLLGYAYLVQEGDSETLISEIRQTHYKRFKPTAEAYDHLDELIARKSADILKPLYRYEMAVSDVNKVDGAEISPTTLGANIHLAGDPKVRHVNLSSPRFNADINALLAAYSDEKAAKAKDAELVNAIDAEDAYRIAKEYTLGEEFVISINANPCDASIRIAAILLQMANKSFSPVFRWENGALTEQTWREALDSCGVHKDKADVNEIQINVDDAWEISEQYDLPKGWRLTFRGNGRRELKTVGITNASDKRVFEWKAENGDILTAHKWGVALATFGKLKGETK